MMAGLTASLSVDLKAYFAAALMGGKMGADLAGSLVEL